MPLNVRFEGDVAILSNFGALLNDPKHFDAVKDVDDLLDQGHRAFVFELVGIREMGATAVGLLTTFTRQIRKDGGEVVLARMSKETAHYLEEMRLDAFWDMFDSMPEAIEFFRRPGT